MTTEKFLSLDGTTIEDRPGPTPDIPSAGLIGRHATFQTDAGQALARALDPLDRNGKAKRIAIHHNRTQKAKRAVEDCEPFKAMGRVASQVVARARERDKQLKAVGEDRNLSDGSGEGPGSDTRDGAGERRGSAPVQKLWVLHSGCVKAQAERRPGGHPGAPGHPAGAAGARGVGADSGQRDVGGSGCALQARRRMTREGLATAFEAPGALSAVSTAPLSPPE